MKLIKPSFEILEQEDGLLGMYRQIERAGRVCYKSEDKITEDSAIKFVERMMASGHGAMLEHGTVYLYLPWNDNNHKEFSKLRVRYITNKFSEVFEKDDYPHGIYITTNLRVLVENKWLDDLQYICDPTEFHKKRITVKFICDRGVSHEFVRHRVFSFAQESTRYCNYSKDKFGHELTFIKPCWIVNPALEGSVFYNDETDEWYSNFSSYIEMDDATQIFLNSLIQSEECYLALLSEGWKPQQARAVLPNSLKTELVMTGFIHDWEHFFKLRDAGSAHPQAYELAHPLHMEFLRRKYLVNLYDEANPD